MLYHGSSVLTRSLQPRPSHALGGQAVVFATPVRWMAALFGARWDDSQLRLDEDPDCPGALLLQECAPGTLHSIIPRDLHVYIYGLSSAGFHEDTRLGLGSEYEVVSNAPVAPLFYTRECVWDLLMTAAHPPLRIVYCSNHQ